MAESVQRYRKKPVEVKAFLYDDNADEIIAWVNSHGGALARRANSTLVSIKTLEGWIYASPGDFVVRGVKGEFYPCRPDIFALTYERADA